MQNTLTGFQIIAANGLQNGEGIAPPNIIANLTTYQSFAPVNNYSNIYSAASALPFGLTSSNANLLISIGANSFPHLFGQVPNDFSSNLGTGSLFTITPARTTALFGNSTTANVYLQSLGQAQAYASSAQAVIGSAATTQWAGGPSISASGGFSAIGGSNIAQFQEVANVIGQLGTLMIPSNPYSGFSNADCFNRILEAGNDTIGNLHLTFFGQNITDPVTGNTWVIGSELFAYIINNPIGLSGIDPFQIVANNPFDTVLGQAADVALAQTGDLDAVVTFFGVGPTAASSVYKWSDCLDIPLVLGTGVTQTISAALNLGDNLLNAYYLIQGLVSNVPGLTNILSMAALGTTMAQITPLPTSNLTAMTAPVSQEDFSNLQASFGPGSGTNGNPTVDDILGSTNFNQALSDTVSGLQPLMTSTIYANVSSDTSKIAVALTNNVFPVVLSDGNSYSDINSLAVGGSSLINQNAQNLANIAPSMTNTSLFTTYNGVAETHNNSIALSANSSPFCPINPVALASNLLSSFPKVGGLVGLVLGIINTYYGASSSVKINNPSQPTMFQKIPGAPNFSPTAILSGFPSSLASMATQTTPNSDEITGLNNVTNCIDSSTLTGQALNATITEAKNAQVLNTNGLPNQSLAANPVSLVTPPTGIHTIGGGIIQS
jgi:hypothetical protein